MDFVTKSLVVVAINMSDNSQKEEMQINLGLLDLTP